MTFTWTTIAILVGGIVLFLLGILAMLAKFYRMVRQGEALIVNTLKAEPVVTFTGKVVFPIIHRAEVMDISVKTVEIDRRGKEGLICKDNIRADIKVTFFVRVNKTREDVLKVAQAVGCVRASDQKTIEELFSAKFSEALKTAGKAMEFAELYDQREQFRDGIINVIGKDLNGYVLEDAAIDYLEQTPIEALDKDNILDAEGIKKITEITTRENIKTNEEKQKERESITKRNVEADERVMELEKQRAEAYAKQQREILTNRAREEAETLRIQAEEKQRAELARIKAEEEIAVNDENRQRQVQVAGKNRERVVGIETQRVEKDTALEAISKEREVELQRISKEKAIEQQKKEIADVVRSRVAVEKTVAEEEERIKDVRSIEMAKREKSVMVIAAEAQAQEKLVKDIKGAEAAEQVAVHRAKERLTLAEAALEAADKEAKAKIRLAEGMQAEEAALGLAAARVKEADAAASEKQGMALVRVQESEAGAIEKRGLAEAKVTLEKLKSEAEGSEKKGLALALVNKEQALAEAVGKEQQGLAEMRVREAEALAVEKRGLADALAIEKRGLAEAAGSKEKLLAEATGTREKLLAEATGTREKLLAEAVGVKERILGEAAGLKEKADAMKLLEGVTREHEEFRLKLEKDRTVELEAIRARLEAAVAQSKVLAEAMHNAKINIVGGDGAFFDRFVKAVTMGQVMDGAVDNSETLRTVFSDYLSGKASLPSDLKDVLSRPALSADAVRNLTLSGLLGRLALGADEPMRAKLEKLISQVKLLKLDNITVGESAPKNEG